MRNAIKCLQFLSDDLSIAPSDGPTLGVGLDENLSQLEPFYGEMDQLQIVQPLKDVFDVLGKRTESVFPSFSDLPSTRFASAIVLSTDKKLETLALVAKAALTCSKGASIWIAGEKDVGIASIAKALVKCGEVSSKTSKAHAMAFEFKITSEDNLNALNKLVVEGDFTHFDDPSSKLSWQTRPGLFSHGKIDKGSELLLQHLFPNMSGTVADLGAGWGFLTRSIYTSHNPSHIALYELDHNALDAAMRNCAELDQSKLSFHWHDVTKQPITTRYDHVVMNPPFHRGKSTQASLGQMFIEQAYRILRERGTLCLVANRHLPYENLLKERFKAVEMVADHNGFKVLRAVR